MTKLDTLAKTLHETAVEKGFWDDFDSERPFVFYAKQIAMIHSEATEIMEAIRKDKGQAEVVEEIADLIIRALDLFEGLKNTGELEKYVSLDQAITRKSLVNKKRPERHGVRG